jgi:hypothetical protein
MASQAKIDANRQNAQKSTGPRTPSGKAIASMNAVKHGLSSRKPIIPGENEADFARFTSEWVAELRPFGAHERLLAEQIIMSAWQIRRVPYLEAGLLTQHMQPDGPHPFAMPAEAYQQLGRLDRHQAALQRTLDRSLRELKQFQADRGDTEPEETTDYTDFTDLQNEPTGVEVPPNLGDESGIIVRCGNSPLPGAGLRPPL